MALLESLRSFFQETMVVSPGRSSTENLSRWIVDGAEEDGGGAGGGPGAGAGEGETTEPEAASSMGRKGTSG